MKFTPNAFVDTNVLVYAADESSPLDRKTVIARELLLGRRLHLSAQVLNEFVVSARNPQKLNLGQAKEREWLAEWLRLPIAPLTVDLFQAALALHLRFGISHWDAIIVATRSPPARGARIETLFWWKRQTVPQVAPRTGGPD